MSNQLMWCTVCRVRQTSNRDKFTGQLVCGPCSNARYFEQLQCGQRIELVLDMLIVRESTVHKILALLKEDEELYKKTKIV